jgi:uncharacterized protein with LGFP repeats
MSRNQNHGKRRGRPDTHFHPSCEQLESREMCAVTFQFDYSLDSGRFFAPAERKAALEQAGRMVTERLTDTLDAIRPSGGNTWSPNIWNPATGSKYTLPGSTSIGADRVLVFVGGRDLANGALGLGGPGACVFSGSAAWQNTLRSRGEPGALANLPTDFAPSVGSVAFDSIGTSWHFGSTTNGLDSNEIDFVSVAVHELVHVLGFGLSPSWKSYASGGIFKGPQSTAAAGHYVPMDPLGNHWAEKTQSDGLETIMDPTTPWGERRTMTTLDWAGLSDVGWETVKRSAIDQKYDSLGGKSSFLGAATTEERTCPDGVGRYRAYQGGSIYWTPKTGAFEVHGAIRDKWAKLGWERGVLGYPISDETKTPDGVGRYTVFQGGSIYWTPKTGAFEVHGAIRDKWAKLGWERGVLGYPVSDETKTPDGVGRYTVFQGGSIYWTPKTGAFEVHGAIRDKWAKLGWERGVLGYPISDETKTPDGAGRYNHFQNGSIYWSPSTGAFEVHGSIRSYWANAGWERSWLGYPKSDEYSWNGGRRSDFQFGYLFWTPAQGVQAYRY